DEPAWASPAATATAVMSNGTSTPSAAMMAPGRLVVGVVAGTRLRRRDDFGQQRLVLQLVEETGLGITARGLPARDHGAGIIVELAGHLGIETKPIQPALHVAALTLLETDLVFRGLVGLLGEGGGIDAGRQVARRGAGPVLKRGDPGQRQRLELAVGIVGQIGVEFVRLVGFFDRAPE